ncbi:carbohydrate ABC transporter permease [Novisyntrophococcus fermenticellae]|uniref:carbohydrate ABC transporter permease n=1 Tax=Novisyntrophococcus fermenticellae TaxID=2068655 RepID=UPI001E2F6E40|nr:carbohydrate ABC transporter permease [Novisyntrophococcus fermenticellae]
MIKKRVFTGLKHLLLMLLSFIAVFPIYWMIISSLKGDPEIFNYLPFSKDLKFENYQYAFQAMPIGKMLVNSFVNSAVQTVFQLIVAVLAAYGLVRWDFPGKTILYSLFTLTWLVPFQAIMIPNYVQINEWGLNGTVTAIILPYMASSFACISMYQAFASFPKALIDAGRMDGSGELQVLKNIVLPSMGASVASLGIILFINSWNDYMWPMLITKKLEQAPIQIGLKSFVGADVNMWGSMMAATTVSCLPILIIYLVLQRNIVDSFMKWGIK